MAAHYLHTLFSDTARALQQEDGSRDAYARMEAEGVVKPDRLTEREVSFLAARDSLYMASIAADGWPYMQHRGGPAGFVKALGGNRIGFADYPGNRQFLSTANIAEDDRVSLFAMDYPARRRLKLIGHARTIRREDDPALVDALTDRGAPPAERAVLIDIVGFDWNCPKYITPRYTADEWARLEGDTL